MIPLQFSCHNNDHTAQLSLGGHAAPSLTHTHRHTVFCECSHSVLCAIDSRHTHTHTHIWLSSDVSAAACQIRADGSGHEARSLLSWSCCPYTAQYTHSMTLSTSTYRTIIGTHVVVPSKPQPQTWGGCSSPVAVDFQRGADFTDSDQGCRSFLWESTDVAEICRRFLRFCCCQDTNSGYERYGPNRKTRNQERWGWRKLLSKTDCTPLSPRLHFYFLCLLCSVSFKPWKMSDQV